MGCTASCNNRNIDFIDLTKLKSLFINSYEVNSISHLKNSNLDSLNFAGTKVSDISPIKNKKIKFLGFSGLNNENLEILQTLKELETLILQPNSLSPGWENIILKMKDQIKFIGIGPGSYLKSVDKFIEEYKGVNNQNKRREY